MCREAGCSERQTRVVLDVAHGRSNVEIASNLRISPTRAGQTLQAALAKLEDTFQPRTGLSEDEAGLILRLMSRRRGGAPPTPVFDERGRQVGAKARAFGMCAEDIAGHRWDTTRTILELACRITGQPVPFQRLRTLPQRSECGAAMAAEWRRQREQVGQPGRSKRKGKSRRSQSPA